MILNGRINADLDWRLPIQQAHQLDRVSWFLDLGLFSDLPKPLDDSWQFATLQLALDHFTDKIWDSFEEKTGEIVIYKGPVPDAEQALFMRELFDRLPDGLPLKIIVTTEHLATIEEKAYHLSSARLGPFIVAHDAPFDESHPSGVLLPPKEAGYSEELNKILSEIPCLRLLSEERLTLEWNGLDFLYLLHEVDPVVKRKVQGFEAAGGTVVDRTVSATALSL